MKKKLYLIIAIAHLIVPVSLLTPILKITETKVGIEGQIALDVYNINFFQYFLYDIYSVVVIFMLVFLTAEFLGIANACYAIFSKKPHPLSVKMAFILGFSSAVMAALQSGSESYVFFFVCVVSFLVISACSIKLMKDED